MPVLVLQVGVNSMRFTASHGLEHDRCVDGTAAHRARRIKSMGKWLNALQGQLAFRHFEASETTKRRWDANRAAGIGANATSG